MLAKNRRLKYDGSAGESGFVAQMLKDDASLKMIQLAEINDVLLDRDMQVGGEYKLTRGGADDFFKLVAPGVPALSQFLFDYKRSGVQGQQASRFVSAIVNNLMTMRSEQLSGHKLVCCNDRMQVDGCVSRRYVFVSNKSVYGMFRQSAEFLGNSVGMFTAELYRREMLVVLLSKKELLPGFHVGVLCQNAETAGRAIRVSMIYFDRITRSWSADMFNSESRIRHVKQKQLFEKMMLASESLMKRYKLAKSFGQLLNTASKKPLPGDIKSKDWEQQFRRYLLREADGLSIQVERIDEIIARLKKNRRFTWFGLYAACLYVADSRQLSGSISIRQLAKSLIEKVV